MALLEFLCLYGAAGVGIAFYRYRKGSRDVGGLLATVALWPLFIPWLVERGTASGGGSRRRSVDGGFGEVEELREALQRWHDHPLRSLLPSSEHLDAIGEQLDRLRRKKAELTQLLENELPNERAGLKQLEAAAQRGGSPLRHLEHIEQSVSHLSAMRERTAREEIHLMGLCKRMRLQLLVLRYADGQTEELEALSQQLMLSVEGMNDAREALLTMPQPRASDGLDTSASASP